MRQTDAAVHAVDGPAPRVNRRVLGKGNDVQHGSSEHVRPNASEEGFVVIFRQACGLQVSSIDLGEHHHNINHNNMFGPPERQRKNRWTTALDMKVPEPTVDIGEIKRKYHDIVEEEAGGPEPTQSAEQSSGKKRDKKKKKNK